MKTITTIAIFLTLFTTTLTEGQKPPYKVTNSEIYSQTEEAYVNDIPFDTWMISKKASPDDLIFELPEEQYVSDIPFSTEKIFYDIQMKKLTAQWKDEANVDDMPCNICCSSDGMLIMMKIMPESVKELNVILRDSERLSSEYPF